MSVIYMTTIRNRYQEESITLNLASAFPWGSTHV